MPVMRAIDESVMAAISARCEGSGLRLGHDVSRRRNLAADLLCPGINVRPLAIVARVAAEGFEKQPPPCWPVIEINDACKDTIAAGMKRLFELADLLGLFLDQAADNWMSISERSNGEQPYGLLREGGGVPAHKCRGFRRP